MRQNELYGEGEECVKQNRLHNAIEKFTRAIVVAEFNKDIKTTDLAKKELGKVYFKLGDYKEAYDTFFDLVSSTDDPDHKHFSFMRIAIITAELGNFDEALNIINLLQDNPRGKINKAMLYYNLSKYYDKKDVLDNALRILHSLDLSKLSQTRINRINNLYGMIYQDKKDYDLAKKHYNISVQNETDEQLKGRYMNDLASLYIDCGSLDIAEITLEKAQELIIDETSLLAGYYYKWRGMLEKKKSNSDESKLVAVGFLRKAANILQERGVYKELHKILIELGEIIGEQNFSEGAFYFAEGIAYSKKAEEVLTKNDEVFMLLSPCEPTNVCSGVSRERRSFKLG